MGKTRESGELLSNNLLSADHSSQTVNVGSAITFYGGTTGIISATRFKGNGDFVELDVDGHTELDNLNVSGVTTVASLTVNGNISVGGTLTYEDVTNIDSIGIVTARTGIKVLAGGADISGVVTATTFSGSGANLTNLPSDTPADTDVQVTYDVSSNGSSGYRFTGPGYSGADDNPDIYLVRGQRYRFINGTGSSHPFRIQSNTSGTQYTDGVSGDQDGTQDFNVQNDAPSRLYYQCTSHNVMTGNIYITGGADWRMSDVTTAQTPEIFTNLNVGIGTDNPTSILTVVSPGDEVAVFQSSFGGNGPNISLTHKGGSPNDDDTVGSITFNGQDDPAPGDAGGFSLVSYAAIKVISTDVTKDSEDGAITFTTKNVDGFNEKLRITSGGDMGLGTVSPNSYNNYHTLTINGTNGGEVDFEVNSTLTADIFANAGGLFLNTRTSVPIVFSTYNGSSFGERLRIKDNGNVGIGTNNPSTLMHLLGTDTYLTMQSSSASGNAGILFKDSGGTQNGVIFYDFDDDFLKFSTNDDSEALRINSNGDVNIGNKNHLSHSSTVDSLQIGYALNLYEDSYTSGTNNYVVLGNNVYYNSGNKYMRNDEASRIMMNAGNFYFQSAAAGTAGNAVTFTDRLTITSGGQLQATGAADVRLTLGSSGTAGTNDSVHVRADSANLKFMAASGGTTKFEANGTETLSITSEGYVTKPNQPAFNAIGFPAHRYLNTWQGVALSSWNTVSQNGSHFNNTNGRFTAPVAGKYFFIFTTMFHNPNTADFAIYLNKNSGSNAIVLSNNHSGGGNSNGHQWNDATVQAVIDLAANDYITAMASGSNSTTCYMYGASSSKYGSFCGFLIG